VVERDRLDDEAFDRASRGNEQLRDLLEQGSRLMPDFEPLARDLFAIFYKYNVVLVRDVDPAVAEVESPSSLLPDRIVHWVLASPGLERAKAATRLKSSESGHATANALQRTLDLLRQPSSLNEDDLMAQWKMKMLEGRRDELGEQLDVAESLAEGADQVSDELSELIDTLREEQGDVKRELGQMQRAHQRELDRIPLNAENRIKDGVNELEERMDEATETATSLGGGLGFDAAGASASEKLALGEALLSNEKLTRIARLAGLFKQVAIASRKRSLSKRPEAVHSVERGQDLDRLLSGELALLRNPLLRREFLRRYTESALAQYQIEAPEPSGRGPLVVCIDASGSMHGARETWAKAIALTFLEIARRERRAFRALVFSAQETQLRRFDLLESAREGRRGLLAPRVDMTAVVAFADYFPRAGTDFELPLRSAVEALGESRFDRGDIVFITDGGARLSDPFIEWFDTEREALGFEVFAVLVDVGGKESGETSLSRFADEILRVSELSADALEPVFSRV